MKRLTAIDIPGLYCDDIAFCWGPCEMGKCPRNPANIRDRSVPHLFTKEAPEDCPKAERRRNGMNNWKKIINGLEIQLEDLKKYADNDQPLSLTQEQAQEIIAILKEQNENIGHWVVLKNCSNDGVYCSECQTKIFDRYPMKKKYSYFCPHCGARMEGQPVCTFPANIATLNRKDGNQT